MQEPETQDPAVLLKDAEKFDHMAEQAASKGLTDSAEGYRRVAAGCRKRAQAMKD